ncbi:hypothetical protein GCM10011399_08090 [Subtercola lobariae]|uniref:Uncharacterized protein n=1 Tax=Subtercola lobariae TaxID=1588641 RepID=A0A917B2F8_9MICO|nr:hypothetical protein GCM10011399_08090 [Subtercola lobariae]
MTVAHLEGAEGGLLGLIDGYLKDAEPELRNLDTVIEGHHRYCHVSTLQRGPRLETRRTRQANAAGKRGKETQQ